MAVLLGGCSVEGEPSPGEPSAAEPTGLALPPRPRDVPINGVDPCSLLTEAQRAELGLDARPVFDLSPSALYPGPEVPACVIGGNVPRAITVGVSVVTSAGMDVFTSGGLAAELRPTSVLGFPAVVAVPTRFTDYCTVVVEVAPGQLLDIQFRDGGRRPPIPQDQLCRDAEGAANAVVQTLLASR
ncbi:DUF3558 domain-containing protein [Pseudonocardia aurantiaca]|uniref:DUF3558 domain-containing protein n=1 Tax=Pseudonocardia aurantiaca TaxID=75290 RepID=A0ABW4FIA4_9PSEU